MIIIQLFNDTILTCMLIILNPILIITSSLVSQPMFIKTFIIAFLIESDLLGKNIKMYCNFIINHKWFRILVYLILLVSFILGLLHPSMLNDHILYLNEPNNTDVPNTDTPAASSTSTTVTNDSTHSATSSTTVNNILNINVPNSAKDTALTAMGMKIGLEAAKSLPAAGKLVAVGVGGGVALSLSKISDIIDKGKGKGGGKPGEGSNYVMEPAAVEDSIVQSTSDNQLILQHYPFNLLSELFTINQLELACLILILNCFISTLIRHSGFNYSKYIPNNKFKPKIEYLINRYIDIWYKSNIFVFSVSWVCLFVINFTIKYSLHLILSS